MMFYTSDLLMVQLWVRNRSLFQKLHVPFIWEQMQQIWSEFKFDMPIPFSVLIILKYESHANLQIWQLLKMFAYFFFPQLILVISYQQSGDIFFLIEMEGFGFASILVMVFAGQVYLRIKQPELPRPVKVNIHSNILL